MDKKVIEKVWELYQKGWSYERIALELDLQRDEVEKQCKKKQEEKEELESKEREHKEALEQDREEDCDREAEQSKLFNFRVMRSK